MEVFEILQRKGAVNEPGNKCPQCLQGWRDFMKVNEYMLGCYQCGTVFLSKEAIAFQEEHRLAQSAKQVKARELDELASLDGKEDHTMTEENRLFGLKKKYPEEKAEHECPECGKVCKNAIGLSGHMRSHNKK